MGKLKTRGGIALLIIILLASAGGCSIFRNTPDMPFDVGSDSLSALSSRAATGITDYPFNELNKFEVTVYFVYIAMYDPDAAIGGYSMHTLVNKPEGEGITVDLANEKLTDALASELVITDPAGNGVDKIYIGLGDTAVVNGYLYNYDGAGAVYKTTAAGPVFDDGGAPEDWTVDVSGNTPIPASSVDESNPPLKTDLFGVYLWIAGGGDLTGHGHTDITVEGTDIFEFRFPLDMGVIRVSGDTGSKWATIDVNVGTPFVASSTQYYKYYIKRDGETYYTDMMRLLTDINGKMILGQLAGTPFDVDNSSRVFLWGFSVWYNADDTVVDDSVYDTYFSINADSTINFDDHNEAASRVTATNFDLLAAVGDTGTATFNVGGTDIPVEYIRVE